MKLKLFLLFCLSYACMSNTRVVKSERRKIVSGNKVGVNPDDDKRTNTPVPPLKKAIMGVFNSNRESNFYSIKVNERKGHNFWNYKYTYNTKLQIPGEIYDMLYSFPFISSPLDYVAILKEADVYDKSFELTYHYYQKQLLENFPASEGWVSSCVNNGNKAKLSKLELYNDKYGGIILDYSQNPKGRQVLYLRFLLYAS